MLTEVVVLVILIFLNAFFAASEIALISLNDNKIKTMAESGHKKAKLLQNLLSEPSRFLATIQIGITLAGFMASAFASDSFAGRLAEFLYNARVPISLNALQTISMIVITLILSYFTLVLGELVPKRFAMQKAEPISMFVVKPLLLLSKISSPIVKLLTGSTNLMVRMLGVDPNKNNDEVTEEEIRMMVDVGKETGAIQEDEKVMINNIFELDNKTVSDIMTHRSQIISISIESTLKELAGIINTEQYTRYPVYEESVDNIVGTLHAKDLIRYIEYGLDAPFSLKDMIRTPYFIPTSKRIDDLFKELQMNKVHIAIVIDEYGGTAGIVTIEDVLEEIVGNIWDEYDEVEKVIEELDDHTYLIDGCVNLRDLKEILHIEFPEDDYDTLNGFLISQLGRIPEIGERPIIKYSSAVFKVQRVDEKRISKVKVCKYVNAAPDREQ